MPTRTYRCLSCLDATVDRGYDVSHIKVTCEECGEFGRFVQERIYQQYQRFEDEPPDDLDWDRLNQMEKFVVAEKMVREGKSVDDFEVERSDDDTDGDSVDDASEGADAEA